jgi:hypothetical protein
MTDLRMAKSKKGKPRVTRQALEQARAQIKKGEPQARLKSHGEAEARDGDCWITLPEHLALYNGEQAVASAGYVRVHRLDQTSAWEDDKDIRHVPVRGVCLGATEVLTPPEKIRPGENAFPNAKTPEIVSAENDTRPRDHLHDSGVLAFGAGGPKKIARMP